jgi:WD40 repeat protein/tRNA A-37 threonylcarbamoyl transferase component Bud32
MKPEQWPDIKGAFQRVLELAETDRRAYLEELPDAVRREVESLLRAYDQNSAFLEPPGPDSGVELPHADRELVGRRFGPYRVLSQLGEGGMGTVWLAERVDGLFTRRVALKLLHPALMGRVMTERVAREREILASLNHPNIAQLFDAGFAEDGQPYLALEYVSGTPLDQYCDEHRLTVHERLTLFRQVLGAVQYAHAHLVIHRDLKPSNILVSEDGQAHLLDFGIAKLLIQGEAKETQLTQFGGRALTPDYAAPEQIVGAPITTAADVYALGVMLYELLTGERPYRLKRDSRGALEEAILQAEPVAPSRLSIGKAAASRRGTTAKKLTRSLKGDLDTIASKALKKSPSERYPTANAFGEDIARFLSGEVVLAQPDSVAYRVRKFVGRYRVAIAGVCILFLTLAAGLVATTYEAHIAAIQRDAAVQAQERSLMQTAAARLEKGNAAAALGIVLEVLRSRGATRLYPADALSVFQEARAVDRQVLALTGHTVRRAAFSSEGRRIVTASNDKTALIWDAGSGEQLRLLSGHTARVYDAVFSPDGRRIVTASWDKTARVWDAASGEQLQVLSGHTDFVYAAAFSPDGRRIVTASFDKTARVWDAATGRQLRVLSGHTDGVLSAVFSPDGQRVATASTDKTARIWDATSGVQLQVLSGHTGFVESAAFSPDGRRLVTASWDKTARLWDSASGAQLGVLSGHADLVTSAAFSPDGQRIVTGSADKTARIWDAATGQQLRVLSGHTDGVLSAAYSSDGQRIVTASADQSARIWDTSSVEQLQVLSGHTDGVGSAVFSPDGRSIATASSDKTARLWDAASGQQLKVLSGHTALVETAAFSPDGRRIVTASWDRTVRIWDASGGVQLQLLSGHTDRVWGAAFSPDGRRIVSASQDKTARLWDAATGQQLKVLSGHTDTLINAAFSPDGRRIVTASFDKTARIWDSASGKQLDVLSGHTGIVESAVFSPDGARIVTASQDRTVRIWDAASGQQLKVLSGHTDVVGGVVFSPDGARIATASFDRTARIWDAASGEQLQVLSGHTDSVDGVAFSPDGRRIVTASDDHSARIWEARTAALDAQLGWAEAAQFDALSSTERFQLGLPGSSDARRWPEDRSKCDQAAAAPYDPDRRAPGVELEEVATDLALAACSQKVTDVGSTARLLYQHGRALMASGDFFGAGRDFEHALAAGYRAAGVDLGMLLSQESRGMLDVQRSISLYEQAWADGVTIAALELGDLYEHGLHQVGRSSTEYVLAPNAARAWSWYQKGAEAAEPNALARFAQKEDHAALVAGDSANRDAHLLQAFRYYAAASERARLEDWPEDAWRNWRYRRASIARLLEREGMMEQVAKVYRGVLEEHAPPLTAWQRLASLVGMN